MATTIPIKIRGKTLHVTHGTKSRIARFLLDEGYTVSEISKAVPMAYSQVHQIHKKDQAVDANARNYAVARKTLDPQAALKMKPSEIARTVERAQAADRWGDLPPTAYQQKKAARPQKAKVLPRVGKLRTPGLPSDIDVGPCANCGYDLVVTKGGSTGYLLKHVNTTTEEYLAVTQFCNATPQVLLS